MATRAKYNRVRAPEESKQNKPDTDILLRASTHYGKYVSRALTLFFGEDKGFVTIKAAERLMQKALWVAEVVRRKVQGLHQIVHVTERKIVDVYEPKEEGLQVVRDERFLTILQVTLTRTPTAEQSKHPGYHAPLQGKNDYLTKQSWKKGQQQRKAKRQRGGENRGERRDNGERRQRKDFGQRRRDNNGRRDNEQRRGGQRNRGRNNNRD